MRRTAARKPYFHGTSSKKLREILKTGLQASPEEVHYSEDSVKKDNPSEGRSLASYGGVYLTDSPFMAYIFSTKAKEKFGGNRLILAVSYDTVTPGTLVDEDIFLKKVESILGMNIRAVLGTHNPFSETLRGLLDGNRLPYVVDGLKKNPETFEPVLEKIISTIELTVSPTGISKSILDSFVEENIPKEKKDIVLELVNDVLRYYVLHLLELELPRKYASALKAQEDLKKATNTLLRELPELNQARGGSQDSRIRATEDVGFSGDNRIILVAEIINSDEARLRAAKIHLGLENWELIKPVLDKELKAYRVLDPVGTIVYTKKEKPLF